MCTRSKTVKQSDDSCTMIRQLDTRATRAHGNGQRLVDDALPPASVRRKGWMIKCRCGLCAFACLGLFDVGF